MLIPNKFNGYHNGARTLHISSGGGGGGTTQTTSTVQNTNIPEYARGYVENMLGATQEQLFQGTRGPDVTNPETGEVTRGDFNITGFKPYQAYGGTYDAQGKQLSYDPTKGIAGFTPAQLAAQQGITGQYDPVTGKLALGPDGKPINAGLQMPGGFGDASTGLKNLIGQGSAYTAPTDLGYTASAADAIRAEAARSTYAPTLQNYQMSGPDKVATKSFTDAGTAASYMNPYTTNVLDFQNKELERQAGIASTQRGAQAARAGAFGGGRQAIENAEAERNLAMMKNMNTAQGMQKSYEQAMQQFNAEQGYGLQGQIANQQAGLTVGQQNLGANLGVQQLGAQIKSQVELANLANQQQANLQTSAQAQNAALANAAAKNAASQFGAGQKLTSAQTAAQYGLGAQNLGLQAASQLGSLSSQELAAKQGILGMQNQVGAQQQALDQAAKNQAIQDYANEQQYPLMQLGTMSNMLRGLPMQASTTNQYQAAPSAASQAIGTIGAGANIYSAFNPAPPRNAAGGVIKGYAEGGIMSYDMGGEVEEQLESMDEKGLQAQARESSSPSIRKMAQRILRERQMGNKPQGTGPMGVQYQAAQPQMPSYAPGGIVAFAQGKTVYGGPSSEAKEGEEEARGIDLSGKTMDQRLAMPPTTEGGIIGATTQPATQVPAAPAGPSPDVVKEAMRQRDLNTVQANRSTADVIKEIQAERDASGIGDNKAREEYRSQQMAERANMKDEQQRQKHLRLAEFFASWGSTPGPTLVAGMNALKQSIPGIITDQKEAKKARREADKIIYDIDESTRLDKLGMHNEATARREKAAKQAEEYNKYLLTFESQRQSDKRALEVAGIQAKAQTDAAGMRNASDASTSAAANRRADELTRNNFQRNALETKRAAERLETDIAKEARDTTEYTTAKRMASVTKQTKEQRAKADAIVKQYETGWATRRQAAREDLTLAQEQLKEINERLGYGKKKPDNSGGGGAATDRPSIDSFQR